MINRISAQAEAITETEIMVPLSPKTTIIYMIIYVYDYGDISARNCIFKWQTERIDVWFALPVWIDVYLRL